MSVTDLKSGHADAVKCKRTVTIRRSAKDLYTYWSQLENLPLFMRHLVSITTNGSTSHWVAKGPAGKNVEWDARIINDVPNQMLAWESLPDSQIKNAGSIHFHPAPPGRGTEVTVQLSYVPPAGALGKMVATFFGEEPNLQIADDLIRFQALAETGEIPTTKGQASGRNKPEEE
jgi:uncharacterized membrane protein